MTANQDGESAPDIDAVIQRLTAGELAWGATSPTRRRELLLEVCAAATRNAQEWVRIATRIKQLSPDSQHVGEEWISGPYAVIGYIQALQVSLARLIEGRDILDDYRIGTAPDGRLAVRILPHEVFDRLLLNGFHAELWSMPGTTEAELRASAGLGQRTPEHTHGVAVVLGAGNIFSIPPLDVLYQLYAENRTVVLKLNPTTDDLTDVFRAVFKPLIDHDLVEILSGGPEVGAELINHPGVAAVHMTGSEATHDAIVWGTGDAAVTARAAGTPPLSKPITSELGGICPTIVVPGKWSAADLRYQAEHIATQRLHNNGSNCVATQIVILSSDWAQKGEFVRAVEQALNTVPARPNWYPGTTHRIRSARELHSQAERFGDGRTLLTGLDVSDPNESAFSTEYFGPVLGIVEIPGAAAEFLDEAVTVANNRLRGTLGANIIVHPKTMSELGGRLRTAIAELRYGTVGINAWTAVGYLTPRATWGAFPGHTLDDVQSGIGVVHNALLLDHIERTVVTGPFRPAPRSILHGEMTMSPRPPWFVTNTTAATTGRRLAQFAAHPRWRALPAIFASALRG